ncbi:MAG: prolipoprotein diacylglyceryl transferase [Crocinitomicaceae bacterium]|nr:prolipoprotein diacylglyceryl transferase [Crocinitomicaceae bacterium]
MIQAIKWDMTPELIDGWSTPNLYGLLFVTGLIIGYFVVKRMFKKQEISDAILDKLVFYMILATIVGARLGHVLFYGPYWDERYSDGTIAIRGYFDHPMDIIKVWEGGLASHGGVIAILISLFIFSKWVSKKPMLWILDRIAAPGAIAACCIRLGNLVNSEIVGDKTNVSWGFKFIHHDCRTSDVSLCDWALIDARHPSQLYEAIAYLLVFLILIFMYWKRNAWMRQGVMFGTFLILLFGARFLIEFTKIPQVDGRAGWTLNTGQWLSIPFVMAGIYFLWRGLKSKPVPFVPTSTQGSIEENEKTT